MPQKLRDYQQQALDNINKQWERGVHATIVSLFTGLGKTNVFIEDLYRRVRTGDPNFRALVLGPAHLVGQTFGRLMSTYPATFDAYRTVGHKQFRMAGMEIGSKSQPDARVLVGSVPTMIDRADEEEMRELGRITAQDIEETPFGGVRKRATSPRHALVSQRVDDMLYYGLPNYIVYDETHHAVADGSLMLLTRLKEIYELLRLPMFKIVGYTATAWREDGRALNNVFQTIAIHRGYDFGVQNGYLAPLATPIRVQADLGEDKESALKVRDWMNVMAKAWFDKASDRPTVVYLKTIDHAEAFAEYMRQQGVNAAYIEGTKTVTGDGVEMDIEMGRKKVFQDFYQGKTKMITNWGVILEGTDLPPISCIYWGRPTSNSVLLTQAIGRGLRLFEGNEWLPRKKDCLILDVAGRELAILSAGTLAGYKVDPATLEYVKEAQDTEVLLEDDGKDLRDKAREKKLTQTSKGVFYSFGRIIQKSGSFWYHDEENDILSVSIGKTATLVVTPPHYTFKATLDDILRQMELELATNDDPTFHKQYAAVAEMAELQGGYALWLVEDGREITGAIHSDENLDVVLDHAIILAESRGDSAEAFYSRGRSWQNQPQTDGQKKWLANLKKLRKNIGDTDQLTKGQASQLISHLEAYDRRLKRYLAARMQIVAPLLLAQPQPVP